MFMKSLMFSDHNLLVLYKFNFELDIRLEKGGFDTIEEDAHVIINCIICMDKPFPNIEILFLYFN